MFMGTIDTEIAAADRAAVRGRRVLVTGLDEEQGVDIARTFAALGCRMVLCPTYSSDVMQALTEDVARTALETHVFDGAPLDAGSATLQARAAVQPFGGIDIAINCLSSIGGALGPDAGCDDVERLLSERMLPALSSARVIANRMRLTHTEGLIVNVLHAERGTPAPLAGLERAVLQAMTRGEASALAADGVRVNSVYAAAAGPGTPGASGQDIASAVLALTFRSARSISGLVVDAAGAAPRAF